MIGGKQVPPAFTTDFVSSLGLVQPSSVDMVKCFLALHGQSLDADVASAQGLTLDEVRQAVQILSQAGEVMFCKTSRFDNGQMVERWQCRKLGHNPLSYSIQGRNAKSPTRKVNAG